MTTSYRLDFATNVSTLWQSQSLLQQQNLALQQNEHYISDNQALFIFPTVILAELNQEQQAICVAQSNYYFMGLIANLETNIVCQTLQEVIADTSFILGPAVKAALETIIQDEHFHAQLATEFIETTTQATGIDNGVDSIVYTQAQAFTHSHQQIKPELRTVFKLLAVCFIENLVTDELLGLEQANEPDNYFDRLNYLHMRDEIRHAVFFRKVLTSLWRSINPADREYLQQPLITFLRQHIRLSKSDGLKIAIFDMLELSKTQKQKLLDSLIEIQQSADSMNTTDSDDMIVRICQAANVKFDMVSG